MGFAITECCSRKTLCNDLKVVIFLTAPLAKLQPRNTRDCKLWVFLKHQAKGLPNSSSCEEPVVMCMENPPKQRTIFRTPEVMHSGNPSRLPKMLWIKLSQQVVTNDPCFQAESRGLPSHVACTTIYFIS